MSDRAGDSRPAASSAARTRPAGGGRPSLRTCPGSPVGSYHAGVATRYAYLEHDGPLAFAHRGGSAERPENTWSAFAHAVELGYQYLELDVQASSDGVAVVFHDATLDRVTERSGPISSYRWQELRRITLADGQPPVELGALLHSWPDRRFNIDIKRAAALEPAAATIESCAARARVCVTAFSGSRLRWIRRRLGPELCTTLGPGGVAALRTASLVPALRAGRVHRAIGVAPNAQPTPEPDPAPTRQPDPARNPQPTTAPNPLPTRRPYPTLHAGAAQVPTRQGLLPLVDEPLVTYAHQLGLQVHVWTINDRPSMHALLDLGVDGIMTDRPSLLREVLVERNCWH